MERVRNLHRVNTDSLSYEPSGPAAVIGDPDELTAAITNLVENAVTYSGPEVHVTVRTERTGDNLTVRVADRGPGIPKEELKRVFRRFYRVPGRHRLAHQRHRPRPVHRASVAPSGTADGPGRKVRDPVSGSTFALELPVAA